MVTEAVRWYPSKIDGWLVPVLFIPPVAAVAVLVASVLAGSIIDLLVSVAAAVLVGGLYFGLIFPMRYGIDDTHLIIRHGVCRQRILLAEIAEVYPTHNPLSSPALSLERLHVQFGSGFFKGVMISPADRALFLDHLAQQTGLQREGDRLHRT